MIRILAIETSCDETAFALVAAQGGLEKPVFKIEKSVIASQIALHAEWGGVVPNIAKREHLKNLPLIFRKSFRPLIEKGLKIDLLAVTVGPGLEPCLWTGVNFAKQTYQDLKTKNPKLKLAGVNHLEGHLYSFLAQKRINPKSQIPNSKTFPAIGLIVSGGHTILLLMKSLTEWRKIGETRDDAAGETFDKVARMLKLPYPGGPLIEKMARAGNPQAINFPRPMLNQDNYDFSFAGLKTSVLYYLKEKGGEMNQEDVAASFQAAAVETLTAKTMRAAEKFQARSVILAGGVAANKNLRKILRKETAKRKINFFAPAAALNTDNAAMIAAAAYVNFLQKRRRPIKPQANLTV